MVSPLQCVAVLVTLYVIVIGATAYWGVEIMGYDRDTFYWWQFMTVPLIALVLVYLFRWAMRDRSARHISVGTNRVVYE